MRKLSLRMATWPSPISHGGGLKTSCRFMTFLGPYAFFTSPEGLFGVVRGRCLAAAALGVDPEKIAKRGGMERRCRKRIRKREGSKEEAKHLFNGDVNSDDRRSGNQSGGSGNAFLSREAISLAMVILLMTTLWDALSSQKENLGRKLREFFFLTLEVRSSREEYRMIVDWMGRQPQGQWSRNISLMPLSIRGESAMLNEDQEGLGNEYVVGSSFVPGFGSHYMNFHGTRLWITRSIDTSKQYRSSSRVDREDEVLHVMFLSWDRSIVQRFMKEVRSSWEEREQGTVRLYIPGGWGNKWEFLARRLQRPLSTLYLPSTTVMIIEEARIFLQSKSLYMSLGVPWRRGYLFEGAPGTGKSSFILVLASELSLPIYLLSLQSKELDDASLIGLINSVPPRSLLVIEDLETAIKMSPVSNTAIASDATLAVTEVGGGRDSSVSLSALLNAIDGIASSEGRLLVITVNDASRLPSPEALLRPGRVDRRVYFGPLNATTTQAMARAYKSLSLELSSNGITTLSEQEVDASGMPLTPADMQNELLNAIYRNRSSQ